MHILLINYEYPPLGGGAGNATRHIAREIASAGHHVSVLTARFGDLPHEEHTEGFTIIRIPALRKAADRSNPLEMLSYILSSMFWAARTRQKFDVALAFFGIPGGPAAYVLKSVKGVPYMVSLRGGDVPGSQDELRNFHRITKPFIRLIWKQAAEVVANSYGLAQLANRTAPQRDIKVIPNGVDLVGFTPADSLPLGKFMFAGRFSREKGLHDLIQAVSLLSSVERESLHITLVGDGPIRAELIALTEKLHVTACFSFPGWIRREAMPDFYRQHGCFILPSQYEGMPNVVLEAMACGLPIIMTRIPGSHELIQDNGWVIPPSNPSALAVALRDALQNPHETRTKGMASRRLAEQFTWRHTANRYLDLMLSEQSLGN